VLQVEVRSGTVGTSSSRSAHDPGRGDFANGWTLTFDDGFAVRNPTSTTSSS
jgi:hypothetical protein